MRTDLTAQLSRFFTKEGYLELSNVSFETQELFQSIEKTLAKRLHIPEKKLSQKTAESLYLEGRDLWRDQPSLLTFLQKTLGPLCLFLTGQPSLRLACDQWIPGSLDWKENSSLDSMFCLQGLKIGILFCSTTPSSLKPPSLGLLPFPSNSAHVLFVMPHILLNWKEIAFRHPGDLYFVSYSLPNTVYTYNLKDSCVHYLKQFGYHFGDLLQTAHHPLIYKK